MTKKKKSISTIIIFILLSFILILVLFPLIYIIASSFKTNAELMAHPENILPEAFTWNNYKEALQSDSFRAGRMLFNSIWYSGISVIVKLIMSVICGYVFARGEFKGKKVFFAIFSSLMFISLGSITIYPQFEILSKIGLNKSLFGLIVLESFGIPVVNMYLVRGFVNALPKELDEAGTIDGCTFTGILFRIILPLLKPVMATLCILSFQGSWNSYLMPAIFTMTKPNQQTLIVGIMALKNSGAAAVSWNLMLAATTLAIIPVLVLFFFCNKLITENVTGGAVKG